MAKDSLRAMAQMSESAQTILASIETPMFSPQPSGLGFPGDKSQSCYYPGEHVIGPEEISLVSQYMEEHKILPENTRIHKTFVDGHCVYELLLASVEKNAGEEKITKLPGSQAIIRLIKGDHSDELLAICHSLKQAAQYAANSIQETFLDQYQRSFYTGDLEIYKESQKTWIQDTKPSVENIFGFVEPMRDPYGVRAEFEGLVAISDRKETELLTRLVLESSVFIRHLPWATGTSENDGKGPFEKTLFEPPDFTSIYALAWCCSEIWAGKNLPNYNDIRQQNGFKNVVIANRMNARNDKASASPFVGVSEAAAFEKHQYAANYIRVVLHELLGHGTGKLMTEEDGKYNFDIKSPPINPLNKRPIDSWYRSGQTWSSMFGDIAATVEECRAELVAAYLMDDTELLALFGHTSDSEVTAQDLTYNAYVHLGVRGLRDLQNYNVENEKWGQAHSRAYFAMLRCLLADGNGFMTIDCNSAEDQITVHVDRSRIISDGKPALGRMLLRLQMYRSTADVKNCRDYYEDLTRVDGPYLEWRRIVLAQKLPRWVFVQPNTFLEGEKVVLKNYEPTPQGVIQSWAERDI